MSNLPLTAKDLADAFSAVNNDVIEFGHAQSYGGPATPMDVAGVMAVAMTAIARRLEEQTASGGPVVPLPTNTDMAAAMQMLGYSYLKQHAPERLREGVVAVPRSLLTALIETANEALELCHDYGLVDTEQNQERKVNIDAVSAWLTE